MASPTAKENNNRTTKKAKAAKRESQAETQEAKLPKMTPAERDTLLLQVLDRITQDPTPSVPPKAGLTELEKIEPNTVGRHGVEGVVSIYDTDKGHYPDPTERLMKLPELSHHNLEENYDFVWDVEGVIYERNNVTYAEPKFTVELYKWEREGGAGAKTGRKILVGRQIMHEDPLAARRAASKLGVLQEFENTEELLNEMRFFQFRKWLLETFNPPEIDMTRSVKTENIGGQMVEVVDTPIK